MGSNYFPRKKSKLIIFHLKCTKPKQNCIVCIAEHQTLKIIPQIRLIFNFQVYGLPPLHMRPIQNNFWAYFFTNESIFKIFMAVFKTFGLQKGDIVIFFF